MRSGHSFGTDHVTCTLFVHLRYVWCSHNYYRCRYTTPVGNSTSPLHPRTPVGNSTSPLHPRNTMSPISTKKRVSKRCTRGAYRCTLLHPDQIFQHSPAYNPSLNFDFAPWPTTTILASVLERRLVYVVTHILLHIVG